MKFALLLNLVLTTALLGIESPSKNVQITTDFLEVDADVAADLTHGDHAPKTSAECHAALIKLINDKATAAIATLSVTTKSGQRAQASSALQKLYAVEFHQAQGRAGQSPSVPSTPTGVDVPTPSSFEMKSAGAKLEVDPMVSDTTIDLNIAPELTIYLGEDSVMKLPGAGENSTVMSMPRFYEMKTQTSISLSDGGSALAAVMLPPDADGVPQRGKRVLVFVTVRLIAAK